MADKNKNMSMEERGRKGGQATAEKHDKEFYQEIGQKGGEATAENHDKEFYQEIGRKGGEATAENHDKEFYQEIGRKRWRSNLPKTTIKNSIKKMEKREENQAATNVIKTNSSLREVTFSD